MPRDNLLQNAPRGDARSDAQERERADGVPPSMRATQASLASVIVQNSYLQVTTFTWGRDEHQESPRIGPGKHSDTYTGSYRRSFGQWDGFASERLVS